jgi:WD40 repeat protein
LSGNSVPGFPFRQFDQIGYSLADNHESNYQVSQNGEYLAYWNNWEGNYMFQDLIETNRSWSGKLSSSSHLNIYNYGYPNYFPLTKLLFSPLDPQTIVALWQNSIIEAWDFTTSQTHRTLSWEYDYSYTQVSSNTQNEYTMPGAKQSVTSPDNTLNAKADSGKVLVKNINDSTLVHTILANATQNTDLVFSPDSSILATISSGPTIRLWRMSDGRQVCVVNGNGASPDIANAARLFFSDDGRILAVYHQNGELSYWDAQSCHRLETYWLKNTSISPDGSFFIEPQIFQLNLRKLNDGSLIRSLYGDFDRNLSSNKFGFSKDGKFIGAVYMDGTGHLWGILP